MIEYIILGVIQGLTEFLPVSSSGHLVIVQKLLGISGEEIAVSVILHLGTLLAVVIFFCKDILKLLRDIKSASLIILAALITGIIGITEKDFFESLFVSAKAVGLSFAFTGMVILLTRRFMSAKRSRVGLRDAVILGFAQAVAIIPGVSRSGITISTLLFRNIDKEVCFKFSFLVSIPVILGATLLEARKIDFALKSNLFNLSAGFAASLLTGLLALWILNLAVKRAKFYYFGYYCIALAALTLLFIR